MPEKPAAAETDKGAALRERVCADCSSARTDLEALVQSDHAPDAEPRRAELLAWVAERLPDCLPHQVAVEACMQIEQDEAAAGFPDFRVTDLDPAELQEEVLVFIAETQATARNQTTTGEIKDGVPAKVPAEAGEESALLDVEERLEAEQTALKAENTEAQIVEAKKQELTSEKEGRTAELRHLQTMFNQLRAEGAGTADALRLVVASAQNPETKQHLNALLNRVALLQTALPDKPEVVNRLLNTAGLDLAATTVSGSLASFMAAAETDDALSEEDRTTLRQIVNAGDRQMRTGTQVRKTALATTIDPDTGETVALHSADNKAKVAPGVYAFTETGQDVILEINEGNLHRQIDVTGLDGASIGIVAEIMGVAALAESNGAGGFIKHVYGVDFERFAEQATDPLTLAGLRQKLTHLIGTGHDGEILKPDQQRCLLETQMRLVSPSGSLLAWEDDPNGYREGVETLGLDHDVVLAAFGTYTQLHPGQGAISRDQLQSHLHRRFPDMVSSPTSASEGDIAA